jgi:hypothetical protein
LRVADATLLDHCDELRDEGGWVGATTETLKVAAAEASDAECITG